MENCGTTCELPPAGHSAPGGTRAHRCSPISCATGGPVTPITANQQRAGGVCGPSVLMRADAVRPMDTGKTEPRSQPCSPLPAGRRRARALWRHGHQDPRSRACSHNTATTVGMTGTDTRNDLLPARGHSPRGRRGARLRPGDLRAAVVTRLEADRGLEPSGEAAGAGPLTTTCRASHAGPGSPCAHGFWLC